MLFCLCTQFSYSEEPECDVGKSGIMIFHTGMDTFDILPKGALPDFCSIIFI